MPLGQPVSTLTPLPVLAIMGATASGKARLARAVVEATRGVLVSCDSMKVYRRMTIGTAKPDLTATDAPAWHGVDLVEPWETFDANQFRALVAPLAEDARARGVPLILSGGTMLYLKAATEGLADVPPRDDALRDRLRARYQAEGPEVLHAELAEVDPVAAQRIHPNDQRRLVRALEVHTLTGAPLSQSHGQFGQVSPGLRRAVFVLTRDRADMDARIDDRIDVMLARGWLEEARALLELPHPLSKTASQALGYKELMAHAAEHPETPPPTDLVEQIKTRTRRFARKQLTWLRHFDPDDPLHPVRELHLSPEQPPTSHLPTILETLDQLRATNERPPS